MSENMIIALIGVLSSVSVFSMTLIANKISYVMNIRDDTKRKINDEINEMIYKSIEGIHAYEFQLNNFTNEYISFWDEGKLDLNNNIDLLKQYIELKKACISFVKDGREILNYIDSHIVILHKYITYYEKLDNLYYDICEEDDWFCEIVDGYEDELSIYEEDIYEIDMVKVKIEEILDEIYFHTYNLYVNIHNDTYSKFFNNYKLKEISDYRYQSIILKNPKEKEL